MHTCAQHFSGNWDGVFAPVTGTLIADATVRIKPGPDGNGHPVLSLELQDVEGTTAHTVSVRQVYPMADRAQAEARAAQLRKGMHVTVRTNLSAAHLSLPDVQQIEVHTA